MRKPTRPRDVGRGERVVRGVWRLRLPLALPGIPHVNAWALESRDGIVLVDCGMAIRGAMGDLERALAQAGWELADVSLLVITHAHIDHCGQAPRVAERAGCEVWMHPAWRSHALPASGGADAERALAQRVEIARQSGVPEGPLMQWAERTREQETGQAPGLASDRDLVPGVEIVTESGSWQVIETPGHAPSHVTLHLPEQRSIISGDHLLGRVSLYFEVGATPDPVGEFLASLDKVERLDARLALAGHGRPFNDVPGHITANRELVARMLDAVRATLAGLDEPLTAYGVARAVYGDAFTDVSAHWLMSMTLAWLTHLSALGEAVNVGGEPERWKLS